MNSQPQQTDARFERLRKTRAKAVKLIAYVLGLSVFVAKLIELLNIAHLHLLDYLYLVLLASLGIKVATWILISETELEMLSHWLKPKSYELPSEMVTIFTLAVTLTLLILTARHLVLFGICYVLYSFGNLYGWWRLRQELRIAIPATLKRLNDEKPPNAGTNLKALDVMTAYYLKPAHVLRSWIILFAAAVALCTAYYAWLHQSQSGYVAAYIVCILDILLVEEATIAYYRLRFYSAMRSVSAEEY